MKTSSRNSQETGSLPILKNAPMRARATPRCSPDSRAACLCRGHGRHAGRSDGSVLLMSLGAVVVLSITIGALLSFVSTETVAVSRRSSRVDAAYGAESATRRMMAQVRALYFGTYSTNSYLTGSLAAPTDSQLGALTNSANSAASLAALGDYYSFANMSVAYTTGTSTNRYVQYAIPDTDEDLSAYAGLTAQRATIQCTADATNKNARFAISSKVRQTFNINYIPVFQYAIFHNMDMEVFNGPAMTVNGKVHVNGTLYYAPAATLAIQSSLTASGDIERGIKVWDSAKPTSFSSLTTSAQNTYRDSNYPAGTLNPATGVAYTDAERTTLAQTKWPIDPANWVSTDPTVTGYGEASFTVKKAGTTTQVDFRTSTSPLTYFDSESANWAGGALTRWNGGVKTKDQGIDAVSPPVPSDVVATSSDPFNPYHVMIEHPNLDAGGVPTDSTNLKAAKMAYNATMLVQRSGTNVVFRLRDTSGNWHRVNNLRNASNIVPTATTTVHDQREYLQNGGVKMTTTEFDVSAFYGAGSATAGATDGSGVWQTSSSTPITTDADGATFTPVPFDGSIYLYDDNYSSTRKPAIRVKNGATIYDKDSNTSGNNGIAILSENPIYVQGHFNADGSTTTGPEKTGASYENKPPALIAGDVINVLSTAWDSADDNPGGGAFSASTYGGRSGATTTEINAAIMGGVNQSAQSVVVSSFDGTTGGVNNFPRFLEAWSSTFKYSGSMVALWYGAQSTSKYRGAGTVNGVFSAPTRDWAFNTEYLNPNKLPRNTPIIRVYTTADWKNF
ncbi:MAG: hypothetical protein HY360_01790 [Verrucomicrobia bacterium]|nr:hypothetical protein [Verrucomicrobiota bacterium]